MKPSRAIPVAALVVLVLVSLAVASNLVGRGPGRGEALARVHGAAVVRRASGATQVVTDEVFLHRGDRLTLQRGSADFELADHVRYQARRSLGDREPVVLMGQVPALRAGELLVTGTARTSTPPAVSVAGTVVRLWSAAGPSPGPDDGIDGATGAMRLSHTLAVGVEVYRGRAEVESAGATGRVAALRSVDVPAIGSVPRSVRPLNARADDPWDRLFLGSALTLDRQLATLLPTWARANGPAWTPAQLRARLPGMPSVERLASLVAPERDGAETMVGATIAGLGQRSSFEGRWRDVFGFHDAGASWGLVALDQVVEPSTVFRVAAATLDATPFPFPDQRTGVGNGATPVGAGGSLGRGPGGVVLDGTEAGGSPVSTGGTGAGPGGAFGPVSTGGRSAGPGGAPLAGGTAPVRPAGAPGSPTGPAGGGPGSGGIGGGSSDPGAPQPLVTLPPVTLPQVTVPLVTLPLVTVPLVTVPPVTLPLVTVPPVTLPLVTLPPVTVPPVTVPPVTLPLVTVPPVTLPLVTLPLVTVPLVGLSPVTVPPAALLPVAVPLGALPPATVPPVAVPLGALPPATVPPVTVPTVTVPRVTVPPVPPVPATVTVPSVTVPPGPATVSPVTVPPGTPADTLPTGIVGRLQGVGGVLGG